MFAKFLVSWICVFDDMMCFVFLQCNVLSAVVALLRHIMFML
jgi:hypothetical protein